MSIYGYDHSFAIPVDKENDLQHIDLMLAYTDQDTESGYMIRMNATMSPWQIIKGSQNSLLRFSIPLSKGQLDIEGPIPRNYDLANVTMQIEVDSSGNVSVVTILDPDNKLGTTGKGLLRYYFINALFENKDKIHY